ncbi:MBL fold metallo-hydrolase [Novosphingobium sp. ERN07]|uniref:MBL fold metallo-hydrolase n=1 Tax=Novosphingobium sp. ERN07 TaxID=2726187 RepID=UPI0014575AA2|nr:MBL fold metallo-hydrolase [Novosphingobium sp. ERN07]
MGRFSKAVVVLLILAGFAYYWLLVNAGPSGIPARPFDIAALRAAADAKAGAKPTAIRFVTLATRRIPSATLAAGTGLRQITSGVIAWHIDTPNGGIVVDPGLSPPDAKAMSFSHYNNAAMALVDRWMDRAELILFTHSHIDHVGLFLDHPRFDSIVDKAIVTPKMLGGISALWRENGSHISKTRKLAPVEAVAPGVVIIQTPGHTPGSQMIYVQLANGREYILTGDTASLAPNFERATPRSRLVADILAPEDRPAVIGWLKGLKALKERNKSLVLLPSHDADWLATNAAALHISRAPVRPLPSPTK